jgi:hypothetical protein
LLLKTQKIWKAVVCPPWHEAVQCVGAADYSLGTTRNPSTHRRGMCGLGMSPMGAYGMVFRADRSIIDDKPVRLPL